MTKFSIDGTVYGPKEVHALRQDMIELRDIALATNAFSAAIGLSHNIALLHLMANHIWKDEWLKFYQDKDHGKTN